MLNQKLKYYLWITGAFLPFMLWVYFGVRADIDATYLPFWAIDSEFLSEYWYHTFILLCYLVTFVFIYHAFNNQKVKEKEKYGWAIAMIIFHNIMNMVYWWQYIKSPSKDIN